MRNLIDKIAAETNTALKYYDRDENRIFIIKSAIKKDRASRATAADAGQAAERAIALEIYGLISSLPQGRETFLNQVVAILHRHRPNPRQAADGGKYCTCSHATCACPVHWPEVEWGEERDEPIRKTQPPQPDAAAVAEPTTQDWAVHPTQRAQFIRSFIEAILHGDFEHRSWLVAAGEAHIAGKEIPKCPCQKK